MKTKNFKKISVIVIALMLYAGTVLGYSSYNGYSFTMNAAIVDGKRNGNFHYFNSGTASIKGKSYTYDDSSAGGPKKSRICYTLYKDQLFFDKKIGSTTKPNDSSFSYTTLGQVDGGKYYLVITKTHVDYYRTKGSGTLRVLR